MTNSIIAMHENLHMGEMVSGLFTNLTVAINSVQWRSALSMFNYPEQPNKNCIRVEKIIDGETKYVELIRKPLIGNLDLKEKDFGRIYVLEIIDDLDNAFSTTTWKYFVSSEDAFNDPVCDSWKSRILRSRSEFKSNFGGQYIDIKANKAIQVRSMKILNNIFEDYYEDVD